ncbi:MAG: CGGC domain-containing protein [Desulfobacterales bacterium]|nr:CGGC domain-containing protein [Desulfobacterales bacterium]
MEKVLIVGCKKTMDNVCIACSRCMVAFNRNAGEFERYKEQDAELIGIIINFILTCRSKYETQRMTGAVRPFPACGRTNRLRCM